MFLTRKKEKEIRKYIDDKEKECFEASTKMTDPRRDGSRFPRSIKSVEIIKIMYNELFPKQDYGMRGSLKHDLTIKINEHSSSIRRLEKELDKTKDILAEVVDYVYKEEK